MARRPYAGTADAYVIDANGVPTQGRSDDLSTVLVSGTAWTAVTGGTQVTDLQTAAGVTITGGIIVPDQDGKIPRFLGPTDDTARLWLDFGTGKTMILATDLPERVATLEAGGGGGGGTAGPPPATAVVYSANFRSTRPATNAGQFSWTCDGTGDQTEINAAITAVAAEGGGRVQLLGPTFVTSGSIIMKTGVAVVGEGWGTEIRPSSNFQAGIFVLEGVTSHATYLGHLTINGVGREVHGVHYINTTNEVFSTPAPDTNPDACHVIEHIYIVNPGSSTFAGHGIIIEGSGSRAGRYSNIRILSPSGCGLWLKGGVDSHFHMIEIGGAGGGGPTPATSNTAPVGHGFYIGAGDSSMWTSCKAWYSRAAGFYVRATRSAFSSCVAQDNYGPGFWLNFGKGSYASCQADSNGQGNGANSFPRSGFYASSDLNTLVGCTSFDRGGQAWVQQTGFEFTSGFANSRAVGCITYGNSTNSVVTAAPGTTTLDIRADAAGH